jgi:hypothetical protein
MSNHERDSPSEPVAEQAKDERAHGPHRQGERNGVAQLRNGRAEILRHRDDHEREQEKIERVQRLHLAVVRSEVEISVR